jgi:hypothetical protein
MMADTLIFLNEHLKVILYVNECYICMCTYLCSECIYSQASLQNKRRPVAIEIRS